MKRVLGLCLGLCLGLGLAVAPAEAAPANSLRELLVGLGACLSAARTDAPAGDVTIRFSLRRDGALLGRPKVTYARLPKDAAEGRRFMDSVAAAFDRCTPVRITAALGGAIAGRPLSMRIGVRRPETGV